MQSITDKIVYSYLDGIKARYPWAQGANGPVAMERGLALAEKSARTACAGQLKLEGEAWAEALRAHGFTDTATKAALAAFCARVA